MRFFLLVLKSESLLLKDFVKNNIFAIDFDIPFRRNILELVIK